MKWGIGTLDSNFMRYNTDMFMDSTTQVSYKPYFGVIKIGDKKARRMVTKELSHAHLSEFKDISLSQEKNVVNAFIYSSKNCNKLEARIIAPCKLTDFEKFYKQRRMFESRIAFIRRVAKQLNKYKEQLVSGGFV